MKDEFGNDLPYMEKIKILMVLTGLDMKRFCKVTRLSYTNLRRVLLYGQNFSKTMKLKIDVLWNYRKELFYDIFEGYQSPKSFQPLTREKLENYLELERNLEAGNSRNISGSKAQMEKRAPSHLSADEEG